MQAAHQQQAAGPLPPIIQSASNTPQQIGLIPQPAQFTQHVTPVLAKPTDGGPSHIMESQFSRSPQMTSSSISKLGSSSSLARTSSYAQLPGIKPSSGQTSGETTENNKQGNGGKAEGSQKAADENQSSTNSPVLPPIKIESNILSKYDFASSNENEDKEVRLPPIKSLNVSEIDVELKIPQISKLLS